jgi:carbon monoxide dehydrogenase subunit G
MDLTHRFSVPAPVEEAWRAFNNLEALEPCFPGATISSVNGNDFTGSVKIKVGPIALVYNGSGRYVERDGEARRVVIEARGEDRRGNGTATATVTASFSGNGDQTEVEVLTDLAITGKPAQFGEGVISDVSDKLLDQFVSCVSGRFGAGLGDVSWPEGAVESTTRGAGGSEESENEQTVELGAVPEEIDGRSLEEPPAAEEAPKPEPTAATARPAPQAPPHPPAAPTPLPPPAEATPPKLVPGPPKFTPPSDKSQPDVEVFATIGSVVLKRFGPALAVVAVLIFIASKIIKRNR